MGKFDRSKYKKVSSAEIKEQEKNLKEKVNFGGKSGDYISLKSGINVLRIFPAQQKAHSPLFAYPKVTNWLSREVWLFKNDKNKKEWWPKDGEEPDLVKVERGIKRKPVFNSKVHGNTEMDLVEEYMKFAFKYFKDEIQDKGEYDKKVAPILSFKLGIKTQTSWIMYVRKDNVDGSSDHGYIDVSNGVKEQMNTIAAREDEDGPVIVDAFSDPDTGKPIQIKYNKDSEDKSKTYKVTLLYEKESILSDEELEEWEEMVPIEDKVGNQVFKTSDFQLQLQGLEIFDNEHDLGIFQHDEFLDIVEEINGYFPDNEEDESEEESTEEKEVEEEETVGEEETEETEDLLDAMDKEELTAFVQEGDIDVKIRVTHTEERIRENIREELVEAHGYNEEVSGSMVEFINDIVKSKPKVKSKPAKREKGTITGGDKKEKVPFKADKKSGKGNSRLDKLKSKY